MFRFVVNIHSLFRFSVDDLNVSDLYYMHDLMEGLVVVYLFNVKRKMKKNKTKIL